MKIILGNMGNETIALMRWVYETKLTNVTVVYIDTGWAASHWHERIAIGQHLAADYNFSWQTIASTPNFSELVQQRGEFPSTKFQWCAGFLKGLPLLEWLDKHDVCAQAEIYLGLYREKSRAYTNLPERVIDSEHFGGRDVCYPLYNNSTDDIKQLLNRAKVHYLPHRSLECEPCVNNCQSDFSRMNKRDIERAQQLEQQLEKPMFTTVKTGGNSIKDIVQWVQNQPINGDRQTSFDMGCGSIFGCGI